MLLGLYQKKSLAGRQEHLGNAFRTDSTNPTGPSFPHGLYENIWATHGMKSYRAKLMLPHVNRHNTK
jgi:hypothetical protein